ncbi:hypothetical protein GUJ93_ZPchr0458g22852 [Zizania palustris]|uniref:Staygreen protein domain-containing protein n=1 Tax=Zizania palustris TaxID=103762 RepID=A0A8J5RE06_ZIZPA|nr:hypothetical protein GUJ93_ZPchr0458g22852 [Zizania palustris]
MLSLSSEWEQAACPAGKGAATIPRPFRPVSGFSLSTNGKGARGVGERDGELATVLVSSTMSPRSAALCFSAAATARSRHRRFLVVSCDARASDLLYSSLAAKLLGPPTSFDAGKLTVEFGHGHGHGHGKRGAIAFPRAYTLTHCDFTANLTLAVSDTIAADRLRADDVFGEWKQQDGGVMALHVHCFVSGANLLQGLAAGFRYYVFSKELPLVLKAVVHGDGLLFAEQPELLEAKVWVHFHSSSNKYNRLECWGTLRDAANAKRHSLQLHNARRRRTPDTIFSALLALLL